MTGGIIFFANTTRDAAGARTPRNRPLCVPGAVRVPVPVLAPVN